MSVFQTNGEQEVKDKEFLYVKKLHANECLNLRKRQFHDANHIVPSDTIEAPEYSIVGERWNLSHFTRYCNVDDIDEKEGHCRCNLFPPSWWYSNKGREMLNELSTHPSVLNIKSNDSRLYFLYQFFMISEKVPKANLYEYGDEYLSNHIWMHFTDIHDQVQNHMEDQDIRHLLSSKCKQCHTLDDTLKHHTTIWKCLKEFSISKFCKELTLLNEIHLLTLLFHLYIKPFHPSMHSCSPFTIACMVWIQMKPWKRNNSKELWQALHDEIYLGYYNWSHKMRDIASQFKKIKYRNHMIPEGSETEELSLQKKYGHPRNDNIVFYDKHNFHKYVIEGVLFLISVTGWIGRRYNNFDPMECSDKMMKKNGTLWPFEPKDKKYWTLPIFCIRKWDDKGKETKTLVDEIKYDEDKNLTVRIGTDWVEMGNTIRADFRNPKEDQLTIINFWFEYGHAAATRGTAGHKNNELFLNGVDVQDFSIEFQQFIRFLKDMLKQGWIPLETEERLYSKRLRIAGSCDLLMRRVDDPYDAQGRLIILIVDWKFTLLYHDLGWVHQLNMYQYICEDPQEPYNRITAGRVIITFNKDLPDYRIFDIPDIQSVLNNVFVKDRLFMIELEDSLDQKMIQ